LFASLVVISRSTDVADDLTQEAFVRVWERWDRVSEMENPAGYLHRVAVRAYFQWRRTAIRAAKRVVQRAAVSDPFEQVDQADYVERALLTLPPRQRAALVVTEFLGYESKEASRILGIRPGTVRRLASLARKRLHGEAGQEA
jgi:RNA polymerase sigma factor (sigma-70 family)